MNYNTLIIKQFRSLGIASHNDGFIQQRHCEGDSPKQSRRKSCHIASNSGLLPASFLAVRNDVSEINRVFRSLLLFFAIANILPCSGQTRYYVSTTGTPTGDALSWTTSNNDLQLVINNAQAYDTIWVAQGIYLPIRPADSLHKVDSNNSDNAFTITKGLCLYGGFTGTETELSQRQFPLQGSNGLSILSGDIGIPNYRNDNAHHIVVVSAQQDTVLLDGFTLTGGYANKVDTLFINGKSIVSLNGGGIYTTSSLIASRLHIINNYAGTGGGGIRSETTYATTIFLKVDDCVISANEAHGGGGVDTYLSDLYIYNTSITHNSYQKDVMQGRAWGGGLAIDGAGRCILTHVSITDNTAGNGWGGGVIFSVGADIYTTDVVWNHVLIANNTASFGGGLNISMGNSLFNFVITNSTFANNTGLIGGDAFTFSYSIFQKPILIRNSIIFGNKVLRNNNVEVDHNMGGFNVTSPSCLFSHCLQGRSEEVYGADYIYPPPGVILADPLFVDTANRNYRLQCGSPAVNMGSNAFYHPDSLPNLSDIVTDLDGNPRFFNNGIVDMGAYELQELCKPFILLPSDTVICQGDSIDIPILLSGTAPWELVYTTNNNRQDTIRTIQTNPYFFRVSPSDTTLYVFTYIEDMYYDSLILDSIRVSVIPVHRLTAILTNDTLCSGESTKVVQFTNPIDSCQWEATGDTIKNIPLGVQKGNFGSYIVENEDAALLTATIRVAPFVVVENDKTCYGKAEDFSITVRPVIQLQAGVNDSLFCEGDSILFVLLNPERVSDIYWQGTGGFFGTGENPFISHAQPSHTGIYIVRASATPYCVLPDTVKVTVLSAVITAMEDTLFMCDWEDVTVYSNASSANNYLWSTGDTTANINISAPGTYYLEASNERCFVLDTIVVMQINVSDFEIQTTGDLCQDGKVELIAQIDNVSYQWSTGDTTQTIQVSVEGLYSLSVAAGSCQAYREMEINCPCNLLLPNIFTPNNDGVNDVYIPMLTFELHSFSMIIYNRWGVVVYQTDKFIPWDGKIKGKEATEGVYYCVVEYSCKDNPNKKRTAQSSVTLMR